jgi:hypothetical protein
MRPICIFCGAPERCEVFDVWDDGAFMLDACCDGMHDAAVDELQEGPKAAARWLSGLRDEADDVGVEALVGHDLRRVVDDGAGQLLLDWQLQLVPVTWAQARAFIAEHHAHCKPPRGWRFGVGIRNGSRLIGVASIGRPVARAFDAARIVEVNRCCIRRDIARPLAWNACSMLYGWAAREAKKRGFDRIITYTASRCRPPAGRPRRRRGPGRAAGIRPAARAMARRRRTARRRAGAASCAGWPGLLPTAV